MENALTHKRRQAAVAALTTLGAANGGKITPAQVVNAARDPASPMHDYFEWDNDAAAEKYRIDQARTLIRSCRIECTMHHRKVQLPYYTRDPEADVLEQGYVEVGKLQTEEDLARDAVVNEFRRVEALLTRAQAMASFLGLDAEIDALLAQLGLIRDRIEQSEAA